MQSTLTLVGRAREIEGCRELFGRTRGLWIRGAPGVGKSALARAVLSGQPPKKRGARATGPVLIDDADVDLAAAERRVAAALASPDGPPVLVTARSRPRLASIPVHVVRPLSHEETSTLLRARMESLVPGWEVRTSDENGWATLASRLEGNPLAIEIAAVLLRDHAIADVLALLDRDELVTAEAAREPGHHVSFAAALRWQLATLPTMTDALAAIAAFRARVPYELLLHAVEATGATDPGATVAALLDASLLQSAERGAWVSPIIARAALAAAPQLAERSLRIHAEVIRDRAREHASRTAGPVTRSLAPEDLALAAAQLSATSALDDADVPWIRSLLDDVEVGLATRDDPEPVHALVDRLVEALPPSHALGRVARLARAGRQLVSGDPEAHRALDEVPDGSDDLLSRRELLRARAAWRRGALADVDEAVTRGVAHARRAGLRGHVVALLTVSGAAQALRGVPDRATQTLEHALEEAVAIGDDAFVAHVELRLGGLAAELGRSSESTLRLEQARALALRAGHARLAWIAECDLAVGPLADGRFAEVAAAAQACHDRARPSWRGATILLYVAVGEELSGRPVEASRAYVRTLVRARQTGNRLIEAMAQALRARLSADHGELASAERDVAEAEVLFAELDDPTHGALADLARGHIELARAHRERGADRVALERSCAARLARHVGEGGAANRSFDVRLATSVLSARLDKSRSIPPPASPPSAGAVLVERSGRWFQLPFAERTSMDTRGALRRILAGLAVDRVERPGVARTPEDVFALGWPGERCLPESAQARVYVAISSLRKLGLRDLIRRAHDGYFFDPDLDLRVVDGG